MKATFLALLVAICVGTTVAEDVQQQSDSDAAETFALHEFAGDLIRPATAEGPYGARNLSYAANQTLPKVARARLATIKPGLTRAALSVYCEENGGMTANEFFIQNVLVQSHLVCIRLFFRPAAMPESTFTDPKRRQAWLVEHKPEPKSTDVLMHLTKPFWHSYVLD